MHRILTGLSFGFALVAASVASAQAQGAPNGSYLQSCTNISVRGGTLTATCTAPNGQPVRSSLNYHQCGGGDIANSNGSLTCNGSGGGSGYYGGGIPGGSYQQSCTNATMRGSTLSASCTPPSGPRTYSSLNVRNCRGGDIANVNGQLACGGGGGGYYPGGGGYGPPGSYQQSCSNISMNGSMVTATCSATNGQRVTSSLNPNRCRPGTDIANVNGRLECLDYR